MTTTATAITTVLMSYKATDVFVTMAMVVMEKAAVSFMLNSVPVVDMYKLYM